MLVPCRLLSGGALLAVFATSVLLSADTIAIPRQVLSLPLESSLRSAEGQEPAQSERRSAATRFDATQGRLVEVGPGEPRLEQWPGKPWGSKGGVRLENPATNFLSNSSFEADLTGWVVRGEVRASVETEFPLHGQRALRVTGSGCVSHAPVEVTVQGREPLHNLFTLSAYVRREDGKEVTLEQVWPWAAPENQSENAIDWGSRHVERLGETPWYRVSANFGANGAPLAFKVWECGVEVRAGQQALHVDAVQLEQGEPRWMGGASSYIATGDRPAKREGDLLAYALGATGEGPVLPSGEGGVRVPALQPRGSLSLWVRPTMPPNGYWFCPQPWSAGGLILGATWLQINGAHMDYTPPSAGWTFVTVTWDGSLAQVYVNGKSVRPENDPLPYPGFDRWPSPAFALSRAEAGAGADAVLSDVTLWDQPLTPAQVRQLYATGDILGAVEPPQDRLTPVKYTVPGAGAVSLGLYDKAGRLVRTLLSGKQQEAGPQECAWDGRDDAGNPLPVGEYQVRGVVGNLGQEVEYIVGNTAVAGAQVAEQAWKPTLSSFDDYSVYRCMYAGYIGLAMLPDGNCFQQTQSCEASFTTQKVAPDGKVIWSKPCEFGAASYETHAICTDGKYIYSLQPAQFDLNPANRKLRLYEFLGRCSVETGDRVLWPGDRPVFPVSEAREVPDLFAGMYDGADRSNPFPGLNARHVAAGGGKVYIPLHFDNRIDLYDRESGENVGVFADVPQPEGVAVDGVGNLYVCSGKQVLRIAPDGRRATVIAQGLEKPWNLTLDGQGNLYVCDLGTQQVKKFSPEGRLLLTIGKPGGSWNGRVPDDGCNMPMAVAVAPGGEILIADRGHWRTQVFSPDGKRLLQSRMACGTNIPFLNLSNREWLYAEGWGPFGLQVARYRLDWRKKTWALDSMWELNQDTNFADLRRTLAHGGSWHALDLEGKTYIYKLDATLLMRVEPDRIVPCLALGGEGLASVPTVRDAQGREVKLDFDQRWVWVNKNDDYRCQPEEFSFFGKGPLEGWRASYVDPDGTIYVSDRSGRPGIGVYRFPLLGIDGRGNPLYSWDQAEKVWTLPAEDALWPYVALWGFHRDQRGWSYGFVRDDNYGNTQGGFLAGYDERNVRRWKAGRIISGLPRAAEFIQPEAVGVVGDGLVYAWDVSGFCQVFTTDGLYVGKLLSSQWAGDRGGPLNGGGESFDSKTYRIGGQTYLLCGGNAGFRLGLYRVTGMESLKRFTGTVRLTEQALPRPAEPTGPPPRKLQAIVPAPGAVTVDGDLGEWDKSAGQRIVVPGSEGKYKATGYAMYDQDFLYLAYAITDSSPALNTGVLSTLFNGDCVEAFLSTDPALPLAHGWTDRDYQFVLPAFSAVGPDKGRAQITRIQPKLEVVPGADMRLLVWPDKQGYNVEGKIPWVYFGDFRPAPGKKIAWDWNIDWSDASGSVRALQYHWNNGANWQTPTVWGEAEFK